MKLKHDDMSDESIKSLDEENILHELNLIEKSASKKTGDLPEVWIFGYGSLMWFPGFDYDECVKVVARGYSRRFYQGNKTFRGTEELVRWKICNNLLNFKVFNVF